MDLNILFKFVFLNGICTFIRGDSCEVFFDDMYDTVTCVREDTFATSLPTASNFLNKDCEQENSTDFDGLIFHHVTTVETEGCVLRPNLFGFLHLPKVEYFTSHLGSENSILPNNSFAGLCGLKSITLSENGIGTVEAAAFSCLEFLEILDMSRNVIEFLLPDIFKGMQHLTELYLKGNILNQISQGLFDDLASLRILDMGYNTISEIPDKIFLQQASLEKLTLGGNRLGDLNEVVFSYLTELTYLDLSRNRLTYVGKIFSANSNLRFLDISWNAGLLITNDTFKGLSSLTFLSLVHCEMHFLSIGLFVDAISLMRLDMWYNNLTEIDTNAFFGLQNVQNFYLQNNPIANIRGRPFAECGELTMLSLARNRLSKINFDDLQGLCSIVALDLSENAIKSIDSFSFDHMVNLETLSLESNLISTLHGSSISQSILSNLTWLEDLDLTSNKLRRLTNAFINNGKLLTLKISQNSGLELDDKSFRGLFEVKFLYLEACNIDHLPSGLFRDVQKLENLYLQNNNLKEIDSDVFSNIKNLKLLNLNFNNITILRNQPFVHNGKLEYMYMSNNNLSEIKSEYFVGLSSLNSLDISSNCIEKISDKSFYEMPNLYSLNISRNFIPSIERTLHFGNNKKMLQIDVSHNRLTDIRNFNWFNVYETWATNNEIRELYLPQYIEGYASSLEWLDSTVHLEYNNIHRIRIVPSKVKTNETYRTSKTIIFLRGNPLQCDCHAYEFYLHAKKNSTSLIIFPDGLKCHFPAKQRGRHLMNLNSTDFVCDVTELCPENCSCMYTAHDNIQMVNCSGKGYARLPVEIPPNTNVLSMNGNNLTSLDHTNGFLWENLTSLHAENNVIEDNEFFVPNNLKYLGLKGNRLKMFPVAIQKHAEIVKEFKTRLSDNPWPCDCSIIDLKLWLLQHTSQVIDVDQVRCTFANGSVGRVALTRMEDVFLCPELYKIPPNIIAYITGVTVVLLSTSVFLLYFRYRQDIVSVVFTHYNGLYLMWSCDAANERDKVFDCFISYGSADREVALAILEELEYKPPHYKFCIHERNWVPGHFITDNIIDSVRNSRKTIIVLSETFLKSQWFQQEFQAAYYQTLQDRKDRLIFIVKGTIPDSSELDSDVHFVLSSKTYLLWGERWFWEKLRYAIHVQKNFVGQKKRWGFREWIGWLSWRNNQSRQGTPISENI